jgi:hypothetical protein
MGWERNKGSFSAFCLALKIPEPGYFVKKRGVHLAHSAGGWDCPNSVGI